MRFRVGGSNLAEGHGAAAAAGVPFSYPALCSVYKSNAAVATEDYFGAAPSRYFAFVRLQLFLRFFSFFLFSGT